MSEKKMCEMCGNWNDMGHQTFKQQEAAERLNCVVGRKTKTWKQMKMAIVFRLACSVCTGKKQEGTMENLLVAAKTTTTI